MGYKASYREYRPHTFDKVVGQKYIVQTLKNAIANNRIAHAYLFTGPRGTGKTTISKLLAAGVNCLHEGNKPCGECENCKAIINGTYPDVIEIDAASNNSVEEVRDLIEKVKYTPLNGKYKVYIIDEVHMMTSSAFNALLKTLEEPPAHAIFILATTEVHKVLPTIISRCQRFDFQRISDSDLEDEVKYVMGEEEISYEAGVPSLIARLADGGCRDALGILDQAVAYAGNNINEQHIRDIYGVLSIEETIDFIKLFNSGRVIDSIAKLEEFDKKGIDLIRFTNTLIDCFKDVVVFNKTNNDSVLKVLKSAQASLLSNIIDSDTAFKYIDILLDASMNYKKVASPRSYFELSLLKMCNVEHSQDLVKHEYIETKEEEIKIEEPVVIEPEVKEEVVETVEVPVVEEIIDEEPIVQETIEEKTIEQEPVQEITPASVTPSFFKKEETTSHYYVEDKPVEFEKHEEMKVEIQEEVKEEIHQDIKLENILINDDTVLGFLVNCNKDYKGIARSQWNSIVRYLNIPKFADAAKLLRDCSVDAAGEDCVVLTTDYQSQSDQINGYEMYYDCYELIKELMGRPYTFVAITAARFKDFGLVYQQRRLTNSLPTPSHLEPFYNLEALKNNKINHEQKDENVEKGKAIFGDLFSVED